MSDYKKLHLEVINASNSKDWNIAKLEWDFISVYKDSSGRKCLCGHNIVEVCQIQNKHNYHILEVGNECVKQFNLDFDNLGKNLLAIENSLTKNTPVNLAKFALQKGIISQADYNFCINTAKKRNLSDKQKQWKIDINSKIVKRLKQRVCPKCSVGKLIEKNGKFGIFLGCSQYPECSHTETKFN